MYLCYIDESGNPEMSGNTSHFVLAGISLPIWHWHDADREIRRIKRKYDLQDEEIHTAWLLRKYWEQNQIKDFESFNRTKRRREVITYRNRNLLSLQQSQKGRKSLKQTKKNYAHTRKYIHLTLDERRRFVEEIAKCVANWGFARLFAECIDKFHFDPNLTPNSMAEQAFEQLISRFEKFLQNMAINQQHQGDYGLIVHDNNETIAKKHTNMMRKFLRKGTFFTDIRHIIETPLFVDSQLTSMVQIADLCSYALRRYLENGEKTLFELVYERADRRQDKVVGVRHFTKNSCTCKICLEH